MLTPAAQAAPDEVINGSACIPYPAGTATAVSFQHRLFGMSNMAFCNVSTSDRRPLTGLAYVLFSGQVSNGALNARLCVHNGGAAVTCGPQSTIPAGGYPANFVLPPTSIPTNATGAFVQFMFPAGALSEVFEVIPYWSSEVQ